MISETAMRLLRCFPGSFINGPGEFIAHSKGNQYFSLAMCRTERDVKCKVLEWLSRGACKTQPWKTERRNQEFHEFMRNGINEFLETEFSEDDMWVIYDILGNRVRHELTIEFIESGYNMGLLKRQER